jgi:hypothetical protein
MPADTLSDAELQKLLELESKATPGPCSTNHSGPKSLVLANPGAFFDSVAACLMGDDAECFCASRNAIRPLVEELQHLRQEVEKQTVKAKAYGDMAADANETLGGISANRRLREQAKWVADELIRLQAANAKLAETCREAADKLDWHGLSELADKCREAIAAAKE